MRLPPPVIEGPVLKGPYFVQTWFEFDSSHLVIELNGCLYATITRAEAYEENMFSIQGLIMRKLTPLVFLYMPTHDTPYL